MLCTPASCMKQKLLHPFGIVACFLFFSFSFLVCVLCVPLAVTYKRIAPRQRILHAESSCELSRGNISRKRKKPGAGTYQEFVKMCMIRDLTTVCNWFSSLCHRPRPILSRTSIFFQGAVFLRTGDLKTCEND